MSEEPLWVVAFGTYQADTHPRVRVLIEGLRAAGHHVEEVNEPLGLSTAERVSMLRMPWTAPRLALTLGVRWARLARRGRAARARRRPDAVLVGYLGHFDVHLARLVFPGTPVILDHLIFTAGTAIDRGVTLGWLTRLLRVVDHRALAAARVIVVDTEEHRARVPRDLVERTVVAPVGADASWFEAGRAAAPDPGPGDPLKVVFFGLFTPLQGAATIGAALGVLARWGLDERQVSVTMIGSGQDLAATRAAAGAGAPVHWLSWVEPADLPAVVAGHHVALGIFGTTRKGAEVVPNKVYQSAAAGCAIITSDTVPQRRVLGDAAAYVSTGDADALAVALRRLVMDRDLLSRRREQARRLAADRFTAAAVVTDLVDRLARVSTRTSTHPPAPLTPRAALRWPLINEAMRRAAPATTLEIGCGQGAMGARLVGLTPSYTAVEPDPVSYAVARGRIEPRGGTVVNATSADLEQGRTFDLVCAFEVLEHLEDDAAALEEWATRVRHGGHVLLSVPAWQHLYGPSDRAVGHFRRYSPDELRGKLAAAGFQPVDLRLYGWPLAFVLEAVRDRVATGSRDHAPSAEGTARSGRWLQPSRRAAGVAITAGVFPFQVLQRLVPGKGNGIVCLARRVG